MDEDPERVAEERGEWDHPSPTPDVTDPDELKGINRPAVTSAEIEPEPTDAMPDPPQLPDVLFEGELDDGQQVHWFVREDAKVLVMANDTLDHDQYRPVTTTPLIEIGDGEFEWEIPVRLIQGHPDAADVPDAALIRPGWEIHFRASKAMITGSVRTCYAMTTDRLNQLTG